MSDMARLYKIEPGYTYCLTYQGHLTPEAVQQMKANWESATSSRLIVLANVTIVEATSE